MGFSSACPPWAVAASFMVSTASRLSTASESIEALDPGGVRPSQAPGFVYHPNAGLGRTPPAPRYLERWAALREVSDEGSAPPPRSHHRSVALGDHQTALT